MSDEQELAFNTMAADPMDVPHDKLPSPLRMVQFTNQESARRRVNEYLYDFRQDPRTPEQMVAEREAELERERRASFHRAQTVQPPSAAELHPLEPQPMRLVAAIRDTTRRGKRTSETVVESRSDGRGDIQKQRIEAILRLVGDGSSSTDTTLIDIDQPSSSLGGGETNSSKSSPIQLMNAVLKRASGKQSQAELVRLLVEEEAKISTEIMPGEENIFIRLDDSRWLWRFALQSGGYDSMVYEVNGNSIYKHHNGETMLLSSKEVADFHALVERCTGKIQMESAKL